MKVCYTALAAAGLFTIAGLPALAQSQGDKDPTSITCSDFLAMDEEEQLASVEALVAAAEVGTPSDEAGSGEEDSAATSEEDTSAGSTTAEGSDSTATDTDSTEATEETGSAAGDATEATESGSEDERVVALAEACEGNPDMMALDAMPSDM